MTEGWRLVKRETLDTAFSGDGARLYGGRWNHRGTLVVYISESLALAALELLVNMGQEGMALDFAAVKVRIPDAVKVKSLTRLPKDWRAQPPPSSTMEVGTQWALKGQSAVLRVPSVIVPQEFNYVLNPLHSDFRKITMSALEPFSFDPRISGKK